MIDDETAKAIQTLQNLVEKMEKAKTNADAKSEELETQISQINGVLKTLKGV